MKKNKFLITICALLAACCLYTACDRMEEDALPATEQPLVLSDQQRNAFIRPGGETIINLSDKIRLNKNLKLNIGNHPKKGSLEFLEGGLLRYAANSQFKSGTDYFVVKILENAAVVDQDTIQIVIPSDTTLYPCWAGAISDSYQLPSDSSIVGRTQVFNILANDYICDTTSLSLKIFTAPKHGKAKIKNNKLLYTPGANFTSSDFLVYQLCESKNAEEKSFCSFARVNITTKTSNPDTTGCTMSAYADAYNFVFNYKPVTYELNVLANDTFCDSLNGGSFRIIEKDPGMNVWIANRRIYYNISDSTIKAGAVPPSSALKYTICNANNQCVSASAVVNLTFKDTTCTVKAYNDSFRVSKDSASVHGLDVLANDVHCNNISSLYISKAPIHGNAYFGNDRMLYYTQTQNTFGSDSLRYSICTADSVCSEASVVLTIR